MTYSLKGQVRRPGNAVRLLIAELGDLRTSRPAEVTCVVSPIACLSCHRPCHSEEGMRLRHTRERMKILWQGVQRGAAQLARSLRDVPSDPVLFKGVGAERRDSAVQQSGRHSPRVVFRWEKSIFMGARRKICAPRVVEAPTTSGYTDPHQLIESLV